MTDRYSEMTDQIHNKIKAAAETDDIVMYYSAGPYDPDDMAPFDNLDEVAIQGKCQIEQRADDFWDGSGEGEDFISPMLTNPTWLEVSVLFDLAIRTTGDYHHQFLEGVHKVRELAVADELNPTGINLYQFSTGS